MQIVMQDFKLSDLAVGQLFTFAASPDLHVKVGGVSQYNGVNLVTYVPIGIDPAVTVHIKYGILAVAN